MLHTRDSQSVQAHTRREGRDVHQLRAATQTQSLEAMEAGEETDVRLAHRPVEGEEPGVGGGQD